MLKRWLAPGCSQLANPERPAVQADVRAVLAGQPLPPPTLAFLQAWEDAKREATKSEYAFKPGLNYYTFGSPAS